MISLNFISSWFPSFFASGRLAAAGDGSPRLFPVDAVSAPGHRSSDPAAPEAMPILSASVASSAVQAPLSASKRARLESFLEAMDAAEARKRTSPSASQQAGPTLRDLEDEYAALSPGEQKAIEAEVARLKASPPAPKAAGSADATADSAPPLRGLALAAAVFSKQFAINHSTDRVRNPAATANQEMVDQEAGRPAEGTRAGLFGRTRAAAAWTAEFARKS